MDYISLILIAIGLSFDTFAVSVSTGLILKKIKFQQALKVAFVLAFLQSLMPLIGWFAGKQISQYIGKFDHWIAFVLLSILGVKMIIESFKNDDNNKNFNPLKFNVLLGMGIATSIDALVVGISFAFLDTNIWIAILFIGVVTFLFAMLGMLFGKKIGSKFGKRIEVLGGFILIAIGLKILLGHVI
ncbi:MAG: manganese efflux pump MntP family protein [Bacteroidales bacterium]